MLHIATLVPIMATSTKRSNWSGWSGEAHGSSSLSFISFLLRMPENRAKVRSLHEKRMSQKKGERTTDSASALIRRKITEKGDLTLRCLVLYSGFVLLADVFKMSQANIKKREESLLFSGQWTSLGKFWTHEWGGMITCCKNVENKGLGFSP